MKLRNLLNSILAGLFAYTLGACDTVKEENRLIYVRPAEVNRRVLIEDFTGQCCVNCPTATEEIEKLQKQYGEDNVIAVAIHGGYFGLYTSTPTVTALGTEETREYYDRWNIDSQPAGMVNRRGGAGNYTAWAAAIHHELQEPSPVCISLHTTFDKTTNMLQVKVSTLSTQKLHCKLQLWLTEDCVTAWQLMPDGRPNPEYIHNNVFRKSINGTWGTDFILTESQVETTFTTTINSEWQPANMYVIAFVYDQEGIIQATRQKINK